MLSRLYTILAEELKVLWPRLRKQAHLAKMLEEQ